MYGAKFVPSTFSLSTSIMPWEACWTASMMIKRSGFFSLAALIIASASEERKKSRAINSWHTGVSALYRQWNSENLVHPKITSASAIAASTTLFGFCPSIVRSSIIATDLFVYAAIESHMIFAISKLDRSITIKIFSLSSASLDSSCSS